MFTTISRKVIHCRALFLGLSQLKRGIYESFFWFEEIARFFWRLKSVMWVVDDNKDIKIGLNCWTGLKKWFNRVAVCSKMPNERGKRTQRAKSNCKET